MLSPPFGGRELGAVLLPALLALAFGCSSGSSTPPPSQGNADGAADAKTPAMTGDGPLAPAPDGGGPTPSPDADPTPSPDGGGPPPGPFKPFFAPPLASGQMPVRLQPTEAVTPGSMQLVTFGVPFPRGSLPTADTNKVRVLNAQGQEIPAFVEALTPWRHAVDPAADGAHVRFARVQVKVAFADATTHVPVTVAWGGAARAQSVATLQNPRDGWHQVTTGSFAAGDNVFEPNVFALLPPDVLSQGLVKPMRMQAFAPTVTEARDSPPPSIPFAAGSYREQEHALKNFFYTHLNQDDPRVTAPAVLCPYKAAEGEPWLYDRAGTFYSLYLRSGFFKALRESVRAAQYYKSQLYPAGTTPDAAVGAFRLKNPNPAGYIGANGVMYSYNEPLAYTYWLTGDDEMVEPIKWISKAQEDANDEAYRWTPTAGYTERHVGFRLLAHTVAYEVFGDQPYKAGKPTYKQLMLAGADNLIFHQDGAGGAVPAARIDGALWKYGRQQGDGPEDAFVASGWLSPIVVDAMVRVYAQSERMDVAHFVRRMGTFLKTASELGPDEEYGSPTPLRRVDYVTLIDGSTYAPDGATGEHALEVAAALAWSYYFSLVTNRADPTLKAHANELYKTYAAAVSSWTRPNAPPANTVYRVSPWRKYNWEHRPSPSLSWCLEP
jgi:hypothetical protein